MTEQLYQQEQVVAVLTLAELLSDKWSSRIIIALRESSRFTKLQHHLAISTKTLSNRLKLLEHHGIIVRTIYAQVPLRIEYSLTEKGRELVALLSAFSAWETKWA